MNTLKKKMNKKGFTLAELLIVVAIIAVLVAISIPIFTTQLEKSRDAVSVANIRAAYAEASAAVLTWDGTSATSDGFAISKADTGAITVTITDIEIKSQKNDEWSGEASDAAFQKPADPGVAGTYSAAFTYASNISTDKPTVVLTKTN